MKLDLSKAVALKISAKAKVQTKGGRKYPKRATNSERNEIQIYKYYNRLGTDCNAQFTTDENKVIKFAIGGTPNQTFRWCGIDTFPNVFGRSQGTRMYVCRLDQLDCTPSENSRLQGDR